MRVFRRINLKDPLRIAVDMCKFGLSRFHRLNADRRGATALVFALGRGGLLGLVGLATEGGTWYLQKRHGQNTADVAAVAGVVQLAAGVAAGPVAVTKSVADSARRSGYTSGVSAVEFALALPLLVGILTPMVDIGTALYAKMQVNDAAQAGAEYALIHGWNSSSIRSAVTNATSLSGLTASPVPTITYGCPNGTTIVATSQGSRCANGQIAGTYVTVSAQATYTPLMNYPILGSSFAITATSVVRID